MMHDEETSVEKTSSNISKAYKMVFEYANDAIFIHTLEGQFLEVNKTACERLGYTREELVQMTPLDIDTQTYAELVKQRINTIKKEGHAVFETKHISKEGKTIDVEISSKLIRYKDSMAIMSIARDISERKQKEEKLQKTIWNLRKTKDKMKEINTELKLKNKYISIFNDFSQKITKKIQEDKIIALFFKQVSELFDLDIIAFLFNIQEKLTIKFSFQNDQSKVFKKCINSILLNSYKFWNNDNNTRDGSESLSEIAFDKQDQLRGFLTLPLFNESKQKLIGLIFIGCLNSTTVYSSEYQKNLLTSMGYLTYDALEKIDYQKSYEEEKLLNILNQFPEGIIIFDQYKNVLHQNILAIEFLNKIGSLSDEKRYSQIAGFPVDELLIDTLDKINVNGISIKNGRTRHFKLKSVKKNINFTEEIWILIIEDITDQVMLQSKLEKQNRLSALGQITQGISHEFNNIFSVISGATEIIKKSDCCSENSHLLSMILRNTNKGHELIQKILNFSQKSFYKTEVIEINTFLDDFIPLLKFPMIEKIQVRSKIPLAFLLIDSSQLHELMFSLIRNASEALEKASTIYVTIDLVNYKNVKDHEIVDIEHGFYIHIQISDEGIGMDDNVLEYIFEPFFTTKANHYGLGLAQAYGIVRQNKGYIHVESEVNEGTCANIYLPTYSSSIKFRNTEKIGVNTQKKKEYQKILLVDDNDDIRLLIKTMLENDGYEVIDAKNGQEALSLLEHDFDFSLIITDIMMPIMDGKELIESIKNKPYHKKIPIIVISGYMNEVSQDIDAFLQKPFSKNELLTNIHKLLS